MSSQNPPQSVRAACLGGAMEMSESLNLSKKLFLPFCLGICSPITEGSTVSNGG